VAKERHTSDGKAMMAGEQATIKTILAKTISGCCHRRQLFQLPVVCCSMRGLFSTGNILLECRPGPGVKPQEGRGNWEWQVASGRGRPGGGKGVKAKGQDQSELLAGIADRTWGLAIPLPQGYSNQLNENLLIRSFW